MVEAKLDNNVIASDLHTFGLQIDESLFPSAQTNVSDEAEDPEDLSPRGKILHNLYDYLLLWEIVERESVLNRVRNSPGLSPAESSTEHATDHMEFLELAKDGLVEIGPNTRTHSLPCLTLERQREENFSSKKDLEGLLGLHIAGFAYPNGKVNTDAKEIVQKAGFTYACTSLHDLVRPGCDLYELTRFWQQNVGGDRFIKNIKSWVAI